MRLAVPISIACCTGCARSFTWREFNELPDHVGRNEKRKDGVELTHKECDACETTVTVSGFAELVPESLWRPVENYRLDYPGGRRAPQCIPENNFDRARLWFRARPFARVAAVLLAVSAVGVGAVGWLL